MARRGGGSGPDGEMEGDAVRRARTGRPARGATADPASPVRAFADRVFRKTSSLISDGNPDHDAVARKGGLCTKELTAFGENNVQRNRREVRVSFVVHVE